MSISYDVTSCAQLKCIVSCLNFGFEDIFIDGECLMIHMNHAVNTIYFAMFFSVMNNVLQHIMLFCRWPNFPHTLTHIHSREIVTLHFFSGKYMGYCLKY